MTLSWPERVLRSEFQGKNNAVLRAIIRNHAEHAGMDCVFDRVMFVAKSVALSHSGYASLKTVAVAYAVTDLVSWYAYMHAECAEKEGWEVEVEVRRVRVPSSGIEKARSRSTPRPRRGGDRHPK